MEKAAVAAEVLEAEFPSLKLPVRPPYPPMEAKSVDGLPTEEGWQFEPKWDGFRCLVFREREIVVLQSKAGQSLGRYFPEMVDAFRKLAVGKFVLDGEIVILRNGRLSFDDLLMRIHPAESRIRKLAVETPATFFAFDLLVDEKANDLTAMPLDVRRPRLEDFFGRVPEKGQIRISPKTVDRRAAEEWMGELGTVGLDGVVAKRLDLPYASSERTGMVKIKLLRTADCVVGGFRWAAKGRKIGSLLLGLYDDKGRLNHVGFTSSFSEEERRELEQILKPYIGGEGFTGNAPGGPSRWSTERSGEWVPLRPKLVCEVRYDHFSGGRFRHGTKFLHWRPEKKPDACTYGQVEQKAGKRKSALLAA